MQDKVQKQVLNAIFVVLRPIVKILYRYGIGYREFSEVAKSAFVDVATSDFGIRGRPTNTSRVAVMTGLTRKEVSRIRKELGTGYPSLSFKGTPLAKIIHKWYADEDFLDSDGAPAVLPFDGKKGSFVALVRKYGGDVPPGAVRTEMKRMGALEEEDSGLLRVTRRSVIPEADHDNLTTALMHSSYALMTCIAHNTDPDLSETSWSQFLAYSADIRKLDSGRLRRISADRIKDFAQSFDDLFMAYEELHEEETSSDDSSGAAIAVGAYYFEERDEKMQSLWKR